MMGYGQNGEFEDEDDDEAVAQALIAGSQQTIHQPDAA